MTENQKKLMPYVEARVEGIISDKELHNVRPLLATENEVAAEIRNDTLECMRELYRTGRYVPHKTLNSPALMKKEK